MAQGALNQPEPKRARPRVVRRYFWRALPTDEVKRAFTEHVAPHVIKCGVNLGADNFTALTDPASPACGSLEAYLRRRAGEDVPDLTPESYKEALRGIFDRPWRVKDGEFWEEIAFGAPPDKSRFVPGTFYVERREGSSVEAAKRAVSRVLPKDSGGVDLEARLPSETPRPGPEPPAPKIPFPVAREERPEPKTGGAVDEATRGDHAQAVTPGRITTGPAGEARESPPATSAAPSPTGKAATEALSAVPSVPWPEVPDPDPLGSRWAEVLRGNGHAPASANNGHATAESPRPGEAGNGHATQPAPPPSWSIPVPELMRVAEHVRDKGKGRDLSVAVMTLLEIRNGTRPRTRLYEEVTDLAFGDY